MAARVSSTASADGDAQKNVVRIAILVVTAVRDVVQSAVKQVQVAVFTVLFGFVLGALGALFWRRLSVSKETNRKLRQKQHDATIKAKSWLEEAQKTKLTPVKAPVDGVTFTKEFKALFNAHAPIWTCDPSYSRAHWLNRVIDAAWPFIDTGVSKTVKESVEPILRDSLPSFVKWVGFEKFTLGPRAPTLSGIRTHKSHLENVILDIELTWGSDPDIIVTLYMFGIRFPVKLANLQLKMVLQVTFDPLVDILPCIGALEVCLTDMPEILDFGLFIPPKIDLMSIPGVHGMVRNIVQQSLAPLMLYPYKLHMPIMPNSGIQASSTGMLRVKFISGTGFFKRRNYSKLSRKAGKASGRMTRLLKSDTYFIKFWTRDARQLQTPPRNGDVPNWDGTPDSFVLCDRETTLFMRLVKTGAERVSNYGECQITCGEIADREGPVTLELPFIEPSYYKEECPLEYLIAADGYTYDEIMQRYADIEAWNEKAEQDAVQQRTKYFYRASTAKRSNSKVALPKTINHPTIKVELEYIDTGTPDDVDEEYEQGLITVELVEARNILRVAGNPPNPKVTVRCAKQYFDSTRKIRTSHPKWDNERFVFYNVLADLDTIRIEVTGLNDVKLGYCEIDAKLVRSNVMIRDIFPLQGVDKGAVLLVLTYAPMASKQVLTRQASTM